MGLTDSIKVTYAELKQGLADDDARGVWTALALILGVCSVLVGARFAYVDFGKVNPIISFVAGVATGWLMILLPFVSLLGGAFVVAVVVRCLGVQLSRARDGFWAGSALMLLLMISAGAIFAAIVYGISHIPLVGEKIAFLLSGP